MDVSKMLRAMMQMIKVNGKEVTQAELARLLNVTPNTINRWVRGRTIPSNEYIYQICRLFACSVDYFDDDSMANTEKLKELKEFVALVEYLKVFGFDIKLDNPSKYIHSISSSDNEKDHLLVSFELLKACEDIRKYIDYRLFHIHDDENLIDYSDDNNPLD